MDAERWQRLSPLLDALLELDPATRSSSLQSLREEDPLLAADLEGLLALEDEGNDFLSEPLIPPLPGARPDAMVGPYRLERMLGEGGMGQVWLASRADGLYQRRVALKLLRPGLADPNLRLRFTRERQILARLEHPHIARLLDAGISSDNQPYLALEYVEGEAITDWCRARALGVDACVRLFLQVCEAVSHAHANLIVHRDLKPSNILVTALDEARLLDFGIAKLLDSAEQAPDQTRTGLRAFTLHYAAPEQIRGEPVTTMTDVYSLGVVLYELLSGSKPYRLKRQSDAEWEEAILGADPVRPSLALLHHRDDHGQDAPTQRKRARAVSGDLDNIVLKTLAKRPEQRYPSVEALSLDLQRYLGGKPVHARPQSVSYRLRKYLHRHRFALSTAALVLLVTATAFGIVVWQARQSMQEGARAQALQDFVVGLFENAGNAPEGTPLDVRQLLEAGVQRGDRELARQPVAHAELLGVIARLRLGLGDYDRARILLERQRAIIDRIDHAPPSLYLESATDLGRTQRLLGKQAACIDTMRPWQKTARQEDRQLPVQVSEFYSQLGRCHRAQGERETARILFERALALRRDPLKHDAGIAENLADLAGLHSDAGDALRAEHDLRAALLQLVGKVGGRHPLAIDMLRQLCSLQRNLGNTQLAELDCRNALALALDLHGAQNRASVDARRQLAALHVDQGRFAEAEQEFNQAQAWLLARLGMQHPDVARNDSSLGIVAWERGHLELGLQQMDRAIDIARDSHVPQLLAAYLFNRGMLLHSAGRDREARPALVEALQLRTREFGNAHGIVGDTLRLLGEVDAALGADAPALDELRRAATLTRDNYGPAHPHTQRAALSLAHFEAARGDPRALRRMQALATLPESDVELRKVAWLARAYVAERKCQSLDQAQARRLLQSLEQSLRQAQPEGGAIVREIAAIRLACDNTPG